MAFQNANAVAITGGTAAALTLANCTHNGLFRANASAGALALSVYGNGTWTAQFFAPVGANGILVYGHDGVALQVLHGVTSVVGLMVYGDMKCRMPHRLIIPVGVDLWGVY